jgi:hypothetical protein
MRMPIFSYFIVMGTVLVGLLFWVSNEIDPNSVPLKTSQVVGVPRPFKATRPEPILTAVNFAAATTTASAPDMTSRAVLAAQPSEALAKVDPAARAARAEAPPTKKRLTRMQPPVEYRQNNASVAISRPPGGPRVRPVRHLLILLARF